MLLKAQAGQALQPSLQPRVSSACRRHVVRRQLRVAPADLRGTRGHQDLRRIGQALQKVRPVTRGGRVVHARPTALVLLHAAPRARVPVERDDQHAAVQLEHQALVLHGVPAEGDHAADDHGERPRDLELDAVALAVEVLRHARDRRHGRALPQLHPLSEKAVHHAHRVESQVPADVLVVQARAPQQQWRLERAGRADHQARRDPEGPPPQVPHHAHGSARLHEDPLHARLGQEAEPARGGGV
mmetsp:Transcript_33570/g.106509  ORF Transcript_33570/g.106509 Transcript_33570/m.106509 type:complete len:243 (+) Transcript_33570:466-1194(+)